MSTARPQPPEMVLFDYGQTLVDETHFDPLAGTHAVLAASKNPRGVSAEEVQVLAEGVIADIRLSSPALEIENRQFANYIYSFFGVEFTRSPEEIERLFIDHAFAQSGPTPGAREMLEELRARGIRLGVVSNISFSGAALRRMIGRFFPLDWFEFILASSDCVFRKPHRRIFELTLGRADLKPAAVWFCGDNPVFDVEGAAALGMRAWWYTGALHDRAVPPPACPYTRIEHWEYLLKEILKGE